MSLRHSTQQKEVAALALRELNVSMPYVFEYEAHGSVYLFDCGNAKRIAPSSELADKVREIEAARKLKIYAVTHDFLPSVGEMYSFLCISPYKDDWDGMVKLSSDKQGAYVYAYVYNPVIPEYSESGYVLLSLINGKLLRVG